jgi:hypothetical protein
VLTLGAVLGLTFYAEPQHHHQLGRHQQARLRPRPAHTRTVRSKPVPARARARARNPRTPQPSTARWPRP